MNPNTTYSYRVGSPGAWSNYGTFTTSKNNKEPFSFVYFTDPQANTVEMFDISKKTTHAADAMYPNANFWLSCGDLVETSGATNSEWEWERFFETQKEIFTKKPLVAVTGNHDKSVNKNFTNHAAHFTGSLCYKIIFNCKRKISMENINFLTPRCYSR